MGAEDPQPEPADAHCRRQCEPNMMRDVLHIVVANANNMKPETGGTQTCHADANITRLQTAPRTQLTVLHYHERTPF